MWLIIATPVWRIEPIHTAQPTGMSVFVFVPLSEEEHLLTGMRQPLAAAGAIMLIIALALALVSARQVLLPVRRLGSAARALGAGHLDTRLPVNGQDELSELTATFNDTAAAWSGVCPSCARWRRCPAGSWPTSPTSSGPR